MINSSPAEYAFIIVCIWALQAVAPLSILYTIYDWYFHAAPWRLPLAIRLWMAAETVFYIVFQLIFLDSRFRGAEHPPLLSKKSRHDLFQRCFAKDAFSNPARHIRWWFKGAELEDIGRDSVKSWLAWVLFEGRIGDRSQDEQELEEYTVEVEKLLDRRFKAGKGEARPLRLTLDPIPLSRRSLVWYLCVAIADLHSYVRLLAGEFHLHRLAFSSFFELFPFRLVVLATKERSPVRHLTYWHRPHTSKTHLPVLFVHGIGIGLWPYINFLRQLNEHEKGVELHGQIGIIAVEIMPISFRITHSALGREEMCREIASILEHHKIDQCVLASHSYGTVIATHILHDPCLRSRIDSVVLIDPVSFLLHHPDVAYNFTVRQPVSANEYQLWYFASQDPGVAHTLSRRFFWTESVLWIEDLMTLTQRGIRVTISLSDRDLIVNSKAVKDHLTSQTIETKIIGRKGEVLEHYRERNSTKAVNQISNNPRNCAQKVHGLEILWFEDTDHGQAFDSKAKSVRLVEAVRSHGERMIKL